MAHFNDLCNYSRCYVGTGSQRFQIPVINTHDRLCGGAYTYLGLRFNGHWDTPFLNSNPNHTNTQTKHVNCVRRVAAILNRFLWKNNREKIFAKSLNWLDFSVKIFNNSIYLIFNNINTNSIKWESWSPNICQVVNFEFTGWV